ncbi:hypothetical protein HC256_005229 [Beauveria bassiana]|nr:hypothetical protein HC256_005229 [Beauveria bassiana]
MGGRLQDISEPKLHPVSLFSMHIPYAYTVILINTAYQIVSIVQIVELLFSLKHQHFYHVSSNLLRLATLASLQLVTQQKPESANCQIGWQDFSIQSCQCRNFKYKKKLYAFAQLFLKPVLQELKGQLGAEIPASPLGLPRLGPPKKRLDQ